MVPIQLKIFTPVGTAMSIVVQREDRVRHRAHAGREHVVAPHAEAQEGDERAREDHRGVAEQRLPREDRQHLGDDAEGRQDQDVHLGVAEDPEQVLPEHRVAAAAGNEEVRPEVPVDHQRRPARP